MLHILFLILKIIGIILAVILGLILLLICIVLFVPVCYKAELHGNGSARELTVHAKVSWLFGLIRGVFSLEKGKSDLYVRIAWKKLGGSEPAKDKVKDQPEAKPEPDEQVAGIQKSQETSREEKRDDETDRTTDGTAKEKSEETRTVEALERVPVPDREKIPAESRVSERTEKKFDQSEEAHKESAEKKRDKKEDRKDAPDAGSKIEQITEKIKCTYDKFCDKINKITEKKDKISDFLTDETHKNAFFKLKKEAFRLLRKLMPKRIQGSITFGFEDPSWTGKLLAWISMIYPWIGEHTEITPDFEHRTLSGDLIIRGKLRVVTPVMTAVRLVLSKAVRRSFKDIRNFKL